MKESCVEQYRGIQVGDEVMVTPDSGFRAGITSRHTVKQIMLMDWTGYEHLGNPNLEVFWTFEDGKHAGHYHGVQKLDPNIMLEKSNA